MDKFTICQFGIHFEIFLERYGKELECNNIDLYGYKIKVFLLIQMLYLWDRDGGKEKN